MRDITAWKTEGVEFTGGDLLIGNPSAAAGALARPQVEPRVHEPRMNAYLEMYGATLESFDGTAISVEVAEDADAPALTSSPAE